MIFGAGGHGRVVADAALRAGSWQDIVASDRNPEKCNGQLLEGVSLVMPASVSSRAASIHVAIGNNTWREKESFYWGVDSLASVLHPMAARSEFARIGAGCFVAANAVIAPGAFVASGCIVNHGAVVDHDVEVGAFCHVAPNATLGGGARIGQRVLVGSGAAVMPGMVIGDDVVVGAGAIVCSHLPEAGTYVGAPARRIK